MTKAELLRALEPFDDDIEVLAIDDGRAYEIEDAGYGTILANNYGCLLLHTGARAVVRWMPRKRT
jgi:hypothetical protein